MLSVTDGNAIHSQPPSTFILPVQIYRFPKLFDLYQAHVQNYVNLGMTRALGVCVAQYLPVKQRVWSGRGGPSIGNAYRGGMKFGQSWTRTQTERVSPTNLGPRQKIEMSYVSSMLEIAPWRPLNRSCIAALDPEYHPTRYGRSRAPWHPPAEVEAARLHRLSAYQTQKVSNFHRNIWKLQITQY